MVGHIAVISRPGLLQLAPISQQVRRCEVAIVQQTQRLAGDSHLGNTSKPLRNVSIQLDFRKSDQAATIKARNSRASLRFLLNEFQLCLALHTGRLSEVETDVDRVAFFAVLGHGCRPALNAATAFVVISEL